MDMIITIAIIIVCVLLYVYVFGRVADAVHRKGCFQNLAEEGIYKQGMID